MENFKIHITFSGGSTTLRTTQKRHLSLLSSG